MSGLWRTQYFHQKCHLFIYLMIMVKYYVPSLLKNENFKRTSYIIISIIKRSKNVYPDYFSTWEVRHYKIII